MDIKVSAGAQKNVEVFCCYAREDQSLLKELKKQLMAFQREGLITLWADTDINAGAEWEKEIHLHLNTAHIILLLVSSDFMASEYCYSIEMRRAIERHDRREAQVIPIILRPVNWQDAPFAQLQALPQDAAPILSSRWAYLDEGFADAAKGIRKAVAEQLHLAEEEQEKKTQEHSNPTLPFTERARRVLSLAQEEARHFQQPYIGTEHLLLGLVCADEGSAVKVLVNLGVTHDKVREGVEFIIGHGDCIVRGEIGLTPRAKKVIELAVDEAQLLKSFLYRPRTYSVRDSP